MSEIDLKNMGLDIFGNPGSLKRDTPEYKQYIKSKEWRIRRLQAIERDDRRCRVCNSGENLDVHHRTYKRLGDELSNDLKIGRHTSELQSHLNLVCRLLL